MSRGDDSVGSLTRRDALAGAASVGLASTSGCIRRLRTLVNRDSGDQVSVRIRTMPADEDEVAVTIARHLADNLEAVGVDARLMLMPEDELLRDVLINHDFELYVASHPGATDPDFLRPFTHSRYAGETGWQNPFGFADLTVDELLEEQRTTVGQNRRLAVDDLQRELVRKQPFTTVVIPDDIWGVREDRFVGWRTFGLDSPLTYLALQSTIDDGSAMQPGQDSPTREDPLRVVTTDARVTENNNPIAVEFRNRGTYMGLLYDPLAREYDGQLNPWLATDWTIEDDPVTITVDLREDVRWHDGSAITASDVAFTYRFLSDTSLGSQDSAIPAPHYRDRTTLVESVEVIDDRRAEVTVAASPDLAGTVLTVPILPEGEWHELTEEADIAGVQVAEGTTEALVWDNPEPVGSGPLQFDRRVSGELVTFEPFEDHFIERDGHELDDRFGPIAFTELEIRVAPSTTAAVELVAGDDADATATRLNASDVPRIGRNPDLQLVVQQSRSFYHVGFNADAAPTSNTRFRRIVARLLDKSHVVDAVTDGYATPATTPLAGTDWVPADLMWDDTDPKLPFFGSDGELDEEVAREAFTDAGFRYDDEGRLMAR